MNMSAKRVNITLPRKVLEEVDSLVMKGYYASRSGFIGKAVEHFLPRMKRTGHYLLPDTWEPEGNK